MGFPCFFIVFNRFGFSRTFHYALHMSLHAPSCTFWYTPVLSSLCSQLVNKTVCAPCALAVNLPMRFLVHYTACPQCFPSCIPYVVPAFLCVSFSEGVPSCFVGSFPPVSLLHSVWVFSCLFSSVTPCFLRVFAPIFFVFHHALAYILYLRYHKQINTSNTLKRKSKRLTLCK